jgi:hypothetical protein
MNELKSVALPLVFPLAERWSFDIFADQSFKQHPGRYKYVRKLVDDDYICLFKDPQGLYPTVAAAIAAATPTWRVA